MKSSLTFLFRLVVIPFYKQNAGLFLFFFLLFFGIIPPRFLIATHHAFIQAMLSSVPLTIGVSFFWVFYAGRCLRFTDQVYAQYRHSFLYQFQILPRAQVLIGITFCFLIMYLPVLIYAAIVFSMAIKYSVFWYILSSSLLLLITSIATVFWSMKALFVPTEHEQSAWKLPELPGFRPKRNIPLSLLFISALWADKKIGLVAQKLFSYASFNFFFIRNAEIFREDYFTFFILLIGAMNALLIFNLHKLSEEKLGFLRNLPLSMPHRISTIIITAVILFIPELIFMLISGHKLLTIADSLTLYGVLASEFVLLFSVLYASKLSLNKYVQYVFLLLLSYLFVYLLIPTELIIPFNLGLAYLIFHEQYHAYEFKSQ